MLLKAIDATTAIKNFLFARVEGVTLRTHFDQYVFTQSRLGLDNIAAAAGGLDWAVGWMNFWFHDISSQLMSPHRLRCTTSAFILWPLQGRLRPRGVHSNREFVRRKSQP